MKVSFKDKKFRIIFFALILVIATVAILLSLGIFGKKDAIVEFNGIPVSKGSNEAKFLEEYYSEASDLSWKNQKDLKKVDNDIQRQVKSLVKALNSGKISKTMKYFKEEQRDAYSELFENRPEILDELGGYLSSAEMTYLAEKPGDGSSFYRIAEYNSESDGSGIPIVFINIEGKWYIDSL